jgi:hypothetical protein
MSDKETYAVEIRSGGVLQQTVSVVGPVQINVLRSTPVKPVPVDPGTGYRLLKHGEIIQEGDDFRRNDGGWSPTTAPGAAVSIPGDVYRRKVVAEPSFRILEVGERLRAGDEGWDRETWKQTKVPGSIVPRDVVYRRKLTPDFTGPTYLLLTVGDMILAGDEAWKGEVWGPAPFVGRALGSGNHRPYRRLITVDYRDSSQTPYRALYRGEIIHPGDEVWVGNEWTCSVMCGLPVLGDTLYRRRIPASAQSFTH